MPKKRFMPYEPPPSHVDKRRKTADAETKQPVTEQNEAPVSSFTALIFLV